MQRNLTEFLAAHDHVIEVELVELKGSSPREAGARIFVTPSAIYGTIGGGQLEYLAIDEARRMMRQHKQAMAMSVPLGPEIGQCCGGVVELHFELMDNRARKQAQDRLRQEQEVRPDVFIFGAGHVGRALAENLLLLPVRPILIDSRPAELSLCSATVEQRCTPLPETEIREAKPRSAFIILTHDHALDFLLVREALLRGDAAYVGMIGSKTKRGTFANWFSKEDPSHAPNCLGHVTCPIGAGGTKDKRPSVIAAMVAAEVMTALENATQLAYLR